MKKIIYNILSVVLAATVSLSMVSCEDFLDVKPSNQTEADVLFSAEKGFQEALSGVYTIIAAESLYGRELTFGLVDVIGQRWTNVSSSNATYYYMQRFDYKNTNVISIMDAVWNRMYYGIAQLNSILENIDEKRSVFASESNYSMIKGEALALRAYLHFDLFRLYAPYTTEETAETPWLPYVDEFTRQTTLSITNSKFIEKVNADLDEALELLKKDVIYTGAAAADSYYTNRNYHVNYYAALGLRARVAMYVGNISVANAAALEVINAQESKGLFPFVTLEAATTSVAAHRDRTFSSEHLFALNIRKLDTFIERYFTSVSSVYAFRPRVAVNTLYEGFSEYRSQFYETESGLSDIPSKLWQLDRVTGATVEQKKERMPMLRISEMYYIAAETTADIEKATGYLNTVRRNRGIPTELSGLTEATLSAEILKEYDKEFVCEGQVFYYHKRKNSSKISTQTIAPKYVLPLPQTEIEYGGRNDYYNN